MITDKPFQKIFDKDNRIVALAGNKNTGKTNNIIYLLSTVPKELPIYFFGFDDDVTDYLKKQGYKEISILEHLVDKQKCLIVLDEFQKLKLNDRRNKDILDKVVDFVAHNDVYLLLSSPNIREFNSVIGSVVDRWLLKTVYIDRCVNGSQLKKAITNYSGRYKVLNSISIPKNQLLIINQEEEIIIECKYIKSADSKKTQTNLF